MGPLTARILAGITPFLAAGIFVLGVRVGAHDALLGVILHVPHVSATATVVPIEVNVFEDDRTVRESKPNAHVSASASLCGKEHVLEADTGVHGDGVLAIPLEPGCHDRTLLLRIRVRNPAEPNAESAHVFQETIRLPETPGAPPTPMAPIGRETADGPLTVTALTPALPAQEASSLWVRSRKGAIANLVVEPEGGLDIGKVSASGCDESVWEVRATPLFHVTGMKVTATFKDASQGTASWFGAIPVAKGTAAITLPSSIKSATGLRVPFRFPGPRDSAYVAIDGPDGRHWETRQAPSEPATLPTLNPGLYWLHIASEPLQAAERPQVSTKPFMVSTMTECEAAIDLMNRAGSMDVAKTDGIYEGLPRDAAAKHRLGLFIAMFGLALGLAIEILVLTSVRSSKLVDIEGASLLQSQKRSVIAGILFSALVFSLLATLLWVKVTK
ncbi:MAG: hypothetical protein U0174_16880 [Polyangiaceae bacterium]